MAAAPFTEPEVDGGKFRFLFADHGRHIAAGICRVPDFERKKPSLTRTTKLDIAVGIGALPDHSPLRTKC